MRYDRRVTLRTIERVETDFGFDEVETDTVVPCAMSPISVTKQVEVFGAVKQDAFKIHVQGHPQAKQIREHDPDKPSNQLKRYVITTAVQHRRETVFYVEGVQ